METEFRHNPYDAACTRHVMGEPYDTLARCAACRAAAADAMADMGLGYAETPKADAPPPVTEPGEAARLMRERRNALRERLLVRALDRPWALRLTSWLVQRLVREHAAQVLDEVVKAILDQRRDLHRQARAARRDGQANQQAYFETVGAGLATTTDFLRRMQASLRGPVR